MIELTVHPADFIFTKSTNFSKAFCSITGEALKGAWTYLNLLALATVLVDIDMKGSLFSWEGVVVDLFI